jgi:serine/threonine protein kinase
MHTDPPPISTVQPLTPTALDRLVKVCLAKDPEERWQSVGDLRRELKWIADGGSQTAAPVPVVARRHAREYLAWGLATLATLLAIGVSVLYLRAPRQTDARGSNGCSVNTRTRTPVVQNGMPLTAHCRLCVSP